jgi:hypothetical protein
MFKSLFVSSLVASRGKPQRAVCWSAAFLLVALTGSARAETYTQVLDLEGPTYNTFNFALSYSSPPSPTGSFSIVGGDIQQEFSLPYFSFADGFPNQNTYDASMAPSSVAGATGSVDGTQYVTDVMDPTFNHENPGILAININQNYPTDPTPSFLVLDIDVGFEAGPLLAPEDMQQVFYSTKLLGFGFAGNEYWFAFQGAKKGEIIGGLIETNGDVKIFDLVPTPSSARSGLVLMALAGVVSGGWRFRKRLCASGMQA